MSTVTQAFAHSLAAAAGFQISPDGTVRSGSQIVHRLHCTPEGRLEARTYFDFIEWLGDRQPDRLALVADCARASQLDNLGTLGLALKTAPTLRASLQRMERYFRLLTDTAVYRLNEGPEVAIFSLEQRSDGHPALTLRNECALAGIVRNAGLLVEGEPRFEYIAFRHACEGDPEGYRDYFGCPVIFGAEHDAVAFTSKSLDLRNRLGDRAVSEFMTRHLDLELGDTKSEMPLKSEVLRRLSSDLSTGVPQASALAQDLGLSERTFFRRLAGEGTSFRDLVREAQIGLARDLLANSGHSISEIAFLSGFSEQSTFGRAFKRQVGQTPAQYRSAGADAPRATPQAVLAGYAQNLAGGADTRAASAR